MSEQPEELPNSPFGRMMGLRIIGRRDGEGVVACDVEERHANTQGIAHGGLLTAMIDMAAGVTTAYQPSVGGAGIVTVDLTVHYTAPVRVGDHVVAHGRRRSTGKRIVICDVECKVGDTVVALGVCTLAVRNVRRSPPG